MEISQMAIFCHVNMDQTLNSFTVGRECLHSPSGARIYFCFLDIIMSNERPSEKNSTRKIAGSFKGKLSSLLRLSRAPTSSSIETDSTSDNSIASR